MECNTPPSTQHSLPFSGLWGPPRPLSKVLLVWELTRANQMWKSLKSSKTIFKLPLGLLAHLANVNYLANCFFLPGTGLASLIAKLLVYSSFLRLCLPSFLPQEAHLYLRSFFPSQPSSLPSPFSLRTGTESY